MRFRKVNVHWYMKEAKKQNNHFGWNTYFLHIPIDYWQARQKQVSYQHAISETGVGYFAAPTLTACLWSAPKQKQSKPINGERSDEPEADRYIYLLSGHNKIVVNTQQWSRLTDQWDI